MAEKLIPFDAGAYFDNEEAIAEYLSVVMEKNDLDLLLAAVGDVAKARGMAKITRD